MTNLKIKSLAKSFGLAALTSLTLFACKDDFVSPDSPSGSTILAVASANEDLDIFVAALQKTNQSGSLDNNNSGFFTVFAPTDSAFVAFFRAKLGKPVEFVEDSVLKYISTKMTLSSTVSFSNLSSMLTYHIVSSNLPSSSLTGDGQVFSTLNGARLSISKWGSTLYLNSNLTSLTGVNGALVQTVDNVASNGVVHTINRVLNPVSSASVIAFLGMTVSYATVTPSVGVPAGATNFNVLANALKKTGLALVLLPNKAPLPDYTLLAPDDASFTAYLMANYGGSVSSEATAITFINGLTEETTPKLSAFTDLVRYHIITGRFVTYDMAEGDTFATILEGKSVTSHVSGSAYTIQDLNGASADVSITAKDNLTNAGVAHTINGVLLAQ